MPTQNDHLLSAAARTTQLRKRMCLALAAFVGAVLTVVLGIYLSGTFEKGVDTASARSITRSMDTRGPLVCENCPWNLGGVEDGHDYSYAFRLVNVSDRPVTIISSQGDCGCLRVSAEKDVVQPGETVQIPTTIRVGETLDIFKRQILVITAAPESQRLTLPIIGSLVQSARIASNLQQLDFGEVEKGTKHTALMSLRRNDGTPVTFVRMESDAKWIKLSNDPTASSRVLTAIDIPLVFDASGLAPGSYTAQVTVITDHIAPYDRFDMPIRATVVSRDFGFVRSIFVSQLHAGEFVDVDLRQDGTQFTATSVGFKGDSALAVKLLERNGDRPPQLRIACADDIATPRVAHGTVFLQANSAGAADRYDVEIPVSCYVSVPAKSSVETISVK
jgi:Protein of unknown function (DUF1573)